MKPRIPIYTDDHTIMITAEFWENGYLLKNGQSRIQRFEMDLLVCNDMTLDHFLDALGIGIENRLAEKYGVDNPGDEVELLYREQVYYGNPGLWQNVSEFMEAEPIRGNSPLAPGEQNRHNWLVCWKLFRDCCEEYRRGYAETRDSDRAAVFPGGVPRHPVIACGSIDLGVWDQSELKRMTHVSQIWLDRDHHGERTLRELGFVTSTRLIFDPAMWHRADTLFGEALPGKRNSTAYRVGNVPAIAMDQGPIRILAPKIPEPKIRLYMIPMIMPPLLTLAILFGIGSVGGSPFQMEWTIPFLLAMVLTTGLLGLLGWWVSRRALRMEIKLRCRHYEGYAREMLTKIKQRQEDYVSYLAKQHPPAMDPVSRKDLIHMAAFGKGGMFSREPAHQEYLKVRVGRSLPNTRLVPSPFSIRAETLSTAFHGYRYINIENTALQPFQILSRTGPARDERKAVVGGGYLGNFPEDVSRAYAYLSDAPVLLDFHQSRSIGILFQDTQMSHRPFLANLLLDLCYHHGPERLQIVMLLKPTDDPYQQQEAIRYYKHLPHFRQFMPGYSPFAFDMHQAGFVMDRVQDQMIRRRMKPKGKYPHLLVIVENSDWLFAHPLSGWLPGEDGEWADSGLTFLVCSHFIQDLPQNCSTMVKVTPDGEYYLLPHSRTAESDSESLFAFRPDTVPNRRSNYGTQDETDLYFRAYKTLSAICAERICGIPMTSFLELLDGYSRYLGCTARFLIGCGTDEKMYQERMNEELSKYLQFLSEKRNLAPLDSLRVPVGFGASGIMTLDLHPSRQGPHLLLLSDRGMGKTQFLMTYINSLCMHYTPAEAQLILMDPLPNGLLSKVRVSKLAWRHVSTVYSFPSEMSFDQYIEVGLDLLRNLRQEINDRHVSFARMGIPRSSGRFSRIDAYNQAVQNVMKHAVGKLKLQDEDLQLWLQQNSEHRQIPHLFVVLDNYTQMMEYAQLNARAQRSFVSQLSDILKNGGDYGIHVIVSAQSLEYGLPAELRGSFQSRICFRVEDAKAAMETVGTEKPAGPYFPENGRGYLRCAADGTFGELQVSYSSDQPLIRMERLFQLSYLPFGGPYELLFDSCTTENLLARYGAADGTGRNLNRRPDSVRGRSRPMQPVPAASASSVGRGAEKKDYGLQDDVTIRDFTPGQNWTRPVQATAGSDRRVPQKDSWLQGSTADRGADFVQDQSRPAPTVSVASASSVGRGAEKKDYGLQDDMTIRDFTPGQNWIRPVQATAGSDRRVPQKDSWPQGSAADRGADFVQDQSRPAPTVSVASASSVGRGAEKKDYGLQDEVTIRDFIPGQNWTCPVQATAGSDRRVPQKDSWPQGSAADRGADFVQDQSRPAPTAPAAPASAGGRRRVPKKDSWPNST